MTDVRTRIYFPANDEYVVIGQPAPNTFTAHLEGHPLAGHGTTMLEAIADLVTTLAGLDRGASEEECFI